MKCIIWSTNAAYLSPVGADAATFTFLLQISRHQQQVHADHRLDGARRATSSTPTTAPAGDTLRFNQIASIYLKRGSTVTTSPLVLGEAQAASPDDSLRTFQRCRGCNPAHLSPCCQMDQPEILRIFFPHNITTHKEQRRKKGSCSKAWFSTKNFLLEAQNNFIFSPF